jgi:hypothetical protein
MISRKYIREVLQFEDVQVLLDLIGMKKVRPTMIVNFNWSFCLFYNVTLVERLFFILKTCMNMERLVFIWNKYIFICHHLTLICRIVIFMDILLLLISEKIRRLTVRLDFPFDYQEDKKIRSICHCVSFFTITFFLYIAIDDLQDLCIQSCMKHQLSYWTVVLFCLLSFREISIIQTAKLFFFII